MARNLVTVSARRDYNRIGGASPRELAKVRRASERNEMRMFLRRARLDPDADAPDVRPVTGWDVC